MAEDEAEVEAAEDEVEDEVSPDEVEFTHQLSETILREMKWPFGEIERELRRIEKEFVTRAGDNQEVALDVKQRISKQLLGAALIAYQPHEVCRKIWEEVVDRGFPDRETMTIQTGIYARCCQMNGEFEAGLQVMLPLIAEFEEWLKNAPLTPKMRAFWEGRLAVDYKIRDELKAGIRK